MISELSNMLFLSVMAVTFISCAAYIVFFVSQNKKVRKVARWILVLSGGLQTLYILVRYFQTGHTPITTQHEAAFFFAWATTWAYLSFRWRYTVKNFGTFVSILIFCPALFIGNNVKRDNNSSACVTKCVVANTCRGFYFSIWLSLFGLLWWPYVFIARKRTQK